MTTADFQTQPIVLQSIDDKGISGDAGAVIIPLDKLLLLERAARPTPMPAKFVVTLTGGDRAAGQPAALRGENLVWETATLGQLELPLKSIVSISRISGNREAVASSTAQTEDVVTLLNGDTVHGIIADIDASTVSVQQTGGEKSPVPFDSIGLVTFVSTGKPAQAVSPPRGFRVTLADASAVTASSVRRVDQALSLSLPTGARSVPLDSVISIEQVNGPVTWLSSMTPSESIHTSMLDTTWPARMDRAADGTLIRFGDRIFSRGIGVHSYSRLTFSIDPKYKAFRTQYAISGDLPYADVTVRVKLDGQVVHEHPNFHSGTLAKPVMIDLTGKKQLTLEVDYGGNYDVQDRFNWIEPALLNFKP